MRAVRGDRAGSASATRSPPDVATKIAIKNGWINRKRRQVARRCLAIGDDWAMAVMTRYPASHGLTYGAKICKQVAVQLGTTA